MIRIRAWILRRRQLRDSIGVNGRMRVVLNWPAAPEIAQRRNCRVVVDREPGGCRYCGAVIHPQANAIPHMTGECSRRVAVREEYIPGEGIVYDPGKWWVGHYRDEVKEDTWPDSYRF